MKQLVSVNLTTRTALDWTPPVLKFGESLTLALRCYKNDNGEEIEAPLTVESLKAGVGPTDARPAGGQFALKVGNGAASSENTSSFLEFNVAASALKTALNAVAATAGYGAARSIFTEGSWLIFFGDQSEQVPLEVVNNGLWPLSFGRINAWQLDGKWVHELRLTQLPVAFTSSHEIVLPPQPVITRIQAGYSEVSYSLNEIQELYIPPDFQGAFVIKRGFAKTPLLSRDDDLEAITEALQVLGADCWRVTLPLSYKPTIEFIGDYGGSPQDLLVVEVEQAPPGDLTFTLNFDRAALASALRAQPQVELPLEIRMIATDQSDFTNNLVALSLPLTIQTPVLFAEMEERPVTDWLRPASPKSYTPYGGAQTLTGKKYHPSVEGDGERLEFTITHPLNTDAVFVQVRENASGGKLLVLGTDFDVAIPDADQVIVTALGEAPGVDAWFVMVIGADTVAAWANDLTVTVPQVIAGSGYPSLPDFMDNATERLEELEAVLPSTGPGVTQGSTASTATVLPKITEVLFLDGDFLDAEAGLDPTKLPLRAPYLLPAVHDATVDDLPIPLPSAAENVGKVYKNVSGVPVLIPGSSKIPTKYVAANQYVACDGRSLYVAERDGATNSYYPAAFERELFRMALGEKQLVIGRTLQIEFALQLQLAAAARTKDLFCQAQWVLTLELGTYPADTSPSPVGLNLQNIVWSATPIFSQPILLDPLFRTHPFGVRIQRLAGGIGLDQQLFGNWSGNNDAAPADANFVIRARMGSFDTENSQPLAYGFVYLGLVAGINADGSVNTARAQAKIF